MLSAQHVLLLGCFLKINKKKKVRKVLETFPETSGAGLMDLLRALPTWEAPKMYVPFSPSSPPLRGTLAD